MNLGCPIVDSGKLLRSCAEVHEPIALSFGVVSGLGPDIDVLDGVHVPRGEGRILELFAPICPMVSKAYF